MLHPKLQMRGLGAGEENAPHTAVFNSDNKMSLKNV